jgi:hypothetical protein
MRGVYSFIQFLPPDILGPDVGTYYVMDSSYHEPSVSAYPWLMYPRA